MTKPSKLNSTTLKGSHMTINWDLSQGCKDFSICINQCAYCLVTQSCQTLCSPMDCSVTYHVTKLNIKNYMIISINAEKASDKIQHAL